MNVTNIHKYTDYSKTTTTADHLYLWVFRS